MSETNVVEADSQVRVVADEGEVVGLTAIMLGMAAKKDARPPWFRQTGMDEGEILLHGDWDDEGALVALLTSPTSTGLNLLDGALNGTKADVGKAQVRLMEEMILELPESMVARRDVKWQNKVLVARGSRLVPPADLQMPEGVKGQDRRKALEYYVLSGLPGRLWPMVMVSAWVLGMPELTHLAENGREKGEEEDPPRPPAQESGEDSSGSSEEEESGEG